MEKQLQGYLVEQTNALINAPSVCPEAKASAQAWLDALGTANEEAQTAVYLEELKADIIPIDQLIAFTESEAGAQAFGAETAKKFATHGRAIKAAGGKYCDCPACTAALAMIEKLA